MSSIFFISLQGHSIENDDHLEDKCEIQNLTNIIMDLENKMDAIKRRINYLIMNTKCKEVPCQSVSTQVNILEKRNLNMISLS